MSPYEVPYDQLQPDIRAIAENVCAPAQLEAFRLYLDARAMTPPRGWRYLEQLTGKSRGTLIGSYDGATRNLLRAGVEQDQNGSWHLTDRKDTAA